MFEFSQVDVTRHLRDAIDYYVEQGNALRDLAAKFEVPYSTIERWRTGVSRPLPFLRRSVITFCTGIELDQHGLPFFGPHKLP